MAATYTARNDGMRGGTVEREKALEVALLQIEKQFGKGSVMRMGIDGPADPVQAISTGSLALDLVAAAAAAGEPWEVRELACFRSTLGGPRGARYRVVRTFPLAG